MRIRKFTLWLDGKFQLKLSRATYGNIIMNHSLVMAIENMLIDMETQKVYGMASNASGWAIQIHADK